MRYRTSCGVIPVMVNSRKDYLFLLVQGYGGYWGFPKGHKERHESDFQTAQRELSEETGLVCHHYFDALRFQESYTLSPKKGSKIEKTVIYFVGFVTDTKVKLQTSELRTYGWFTVEEARTRLLSERYEMLLCICQELDSKSFLYEKDISD